MSVAEQDLESIQRHPEKIIGWNLSLLKELDDWQNALGHPNIQVGESAFKVAFELLTPSLINTHVSSILEIPILGMKPLDEWSVIRNTGGYGVVCKVEDRDNPGTWLAVKYLKESPSEVKQQCIRFVREARIWRSLAHPNIVPLLGIWIDFNEHGAPLPAFVSPWMDGGSLFLFLRSEVGRQSTMNFRLKMLLGVLDALQYMHKNYASHGDLCAANILLSDGRAFICDFGLSRIEDGTRGLTSSKSRNYHWIAPERTPSASNFIMVPNPQSDMFEFGATFWETVTGEIPWSGGNPIILRFQQNIRLPQPLNMPLEIWDLLQSFMKDIPEERITAEASFAILQQVVESHIDW